MRNLEQPLNVVKMGVLLLQESHLPLFQKLWKRMNEMPSRSFFRGEQEGIENVLAGDYAYFIESTSLEYLVSRNCNLTQAGYSVIGHNGYGIAMRKGKPHQIP